jgi:hypothetical protein
MSDFQAETNDDFFDGEHTASELVALLIEDFLSEPDSYRTHENVASMRSTSRFR